MDLKELEFVDPEKHWYYQAKLRAVQKSIVSEEIFDAKIVDVGAGSGFFSTSLIQSGHAKEAICIDPGYAAKQPGSLPGVSFVTEAAGVQGDLYLMLDVLEHVESDAELLENYVKGAPWASYFLITVPAFQRLWSYHDEFLGHYRRYTLKDLENVVAQSGLQILQSRYLFGSLAVVAFLTRKLRLNPPKKGDLRPVNPLLNKLLQHFCQSEHSLVPRPPFGLTACILAQKAKRGPCL
jgi:hypothetical protein